MTLYLPVQFIMKILIKPSREDNTLYTVELKQGHQYFRLDYHAPKDDVKWYAKMFRTALTAHDKERKENAKTNGVQQLPEA